MKRNRLKEQLFNVCLTAFSLMIALMIGAVLFMIAGANPLKAYSVMFTAPLQDIFGITEMFVRAAPLLLVALGISISFRSGILNIGGEGADTGRGDIWSFYCLIWTAAALVNHGTPYLCSQLLWGCSMGRDCRMDAGLSECQ